MADAILSAVAERFVIPTIIIIVHTKPEGAIDHGGCYTVCGGRALCVDHRKQDLGRSQPGGGFEDKLEYLSKELKKIRQLLDDADKKGLTGTKSMSDWKSRSDWLKELEDASYELDDVLDEWYTALRQFQIQQQNSSDANAHHVPDPKSNYKLVCKYTSFLSCSCFRKLVVRNDIAKKLEKVKQKIDSILAEKDKYGLVTTTTTTPHSSINDWRVQSTSFVDMAEIYGRDKERDDLMRRVISAMLQAGGQINHLQILSIVGVGGVGKTTLAQLVYNDSGVTEYFELRIWICVSDPFDEVRVVKNIIESVAGSSPDSNQLEVLLQRLKVCISGKKFLVVMDDVWTEDFSKWEPLMNSLKNGSLGSKVLVTTRNERVVKMMGSLEDGIHRLGVLSDQTCWLLLQRIALFGRDESDWKRFESVGMNIANKCKGLPLAAKVLGSFLRFKNRLEEWENVLNCEIWELEKIQVELFPHLLLSYNDLSPRLKCCFSYCAVFPKDTRINVQQLIEQWMAVDYLGSGGSGIGDMELKGREYYENLAMRSLFQDFEKNNLSGQEYCKMHDIVHAFAELLRKKGDKEVGIKNATACKDCRPLLVSHAKQYRSIYFGNMERRRARCRCLTNLRVVRSIGVYGMQSIIISHGIERFIHLRWLDMSGNGLGAKDLETICRLYNLQTLLLQDCDLEEIPVEIGDLIHLRHLNLGKNESLKELPESICNLQELQRLNIEDCKGISKLPQGFHQLVDLKHLHYSGSGILELEGVAELRGLRTLTKFNAGNGRSKLGWLKNLNSLSGFLELAVHLPGFENIVEDAREGELWKKVCIQGLVIGFCSMLDEVEECNEYWESVLNALEPHPQLQKLRIWSYGGSKLPSWMVSPLNQLKIILFKDFRELSSLPHPGRLPCLEEIVISVFEKMEVVGHEFLGTTTQGSNSTIPFPKLKRLAFYACHNWREWEDITTTEEEEADSCVAISIMPCLTELVIFECQNLTALPHRLLGSSLEKLDIFGSTQLKTRYGDREGPAWKSILDVCPRLRPIQY